MSLLARLSTLAGGRHERVVFEQDGRTLSVAQLLQQVATLGSQLRAQGIQPGDRVAILLGRGIEAATAIYAALGSGACYVPVDHSSSVQRMRYVIQDAGCQLVIGSGDAPDWLAGTRYLDLDAVTEPPADEVQVYQTGSEDIAAILYTSGSTGKPKGVAISHRALLAFVDWGTDTFGLDSSDRIASLAPFQFDLSLFDLFTGPCAGATTCFMPDRLKLAPVQLAGWLDECLISTWYTVPSILGFLSLRGGLGKSAPRRLKRILFAGEVFPTHRLKALTRQLPNTDFFNLFGPTETNVCLYWPVDLDRLTGKGSVPVGTSACSAEVRIDPQRGELLVRGPCLMSGYWHNGGVQLSLDEDGWFATGDRVSTNRYGEFEFHGRLDRMIKSAGYRIEPAEIEQTLGCMQQVSGSAVVGLDDPISGSRIAAMVTGNDLGTQAIRSFAGVHLPPWMRPTYYLLQDDLPVLSNGKTDYQRVYHILQQAFRECQNP